MVIESKSTYIRYKNGYEEKKNDEVRRNAHAFWKETYFGLKEKKKRSTFTHLYAPNRVNC